MKREIYEIHATIVDANGTLSIDPRLNNVQYPVSVDSRSYNNDLTKTLNRARGLLGAAESAMSTQDTREIQYGYIIRVSDGMQIEKRLFGSLKDLPDPEPEPEPEPEEEEEPEQNGGE